MYLTGSEKAFLCWTKRCWQPCLSIQGIYKLANFVFFLFLCHSLSPARGCSLTFQLYLPLNLVFSCFCQAESSSWAIYVMPRTGSWLAEIWWLWWQSCLPKNVSRFTSYNLHLAIIKITAMSSCDKITEKKINSKSHVVIRLLRKLTAKVILHRDH